VSRQTVNAVETGKYDPSLPLAFAIARLFSLPIEEVFSPDGESARDSPEGVSLRR
jgi:putative transcriptional regulator